MTTPTALRYFETRARLYRHLWRGSVISTFLNPVMFLAAMGLGLGSLIDGGQGDAALEGVTYLAFLAPGLMAATAMQAAAGDSTWPVMAAIKWLRTYEAALATPLEVPDLVAGHVGFVTLRMLFASGVYGLVAAAFGAMSVLGALVATIPAALTGLAIAAAVMAYTASLERQSGLTALFRFGIVPLFLFSGTFFPITQLPEAIRWIAYVTPLWHGVELTRAAALGTAPFWSSAAHVAVLLAFAGGGAAFAVRKLREQLIS